MTRICFAFAAFLAVATTGETAQLLPYEGQSIDLGGLRGVAYYSRQADGFRIVATLAEGEGGVPVRFEATLADRQKFIISVPGKAGEAARILEFSRAGDTLCVD